MYKCLFAFAFRCAIDTLRIRCIAFDVGFVVFAVEDIIGTDVDQGDAVLFGNLCEILHSDMVDRITSYNVCYTKLLRCR